MLCWRGGGRVLQEVPPLVQVARELGETFLELGQLHKGEGEVFQVVCMVGFVQDDVVGLDGLALGKEDKVGDGQEDDFLEAFVGGSFFHLAGVCLGCIVLGSFDEAWGAGGLHLHDVLVPCGIRAKHIHHAGLVPHKVWRLPGVDEGEVHDVADVSMVQHIVEEVQEDGFVLFFAKNFLEGVVVLGTEVSLFHGTGFCF